MSLRIIPSRSVEKKRQELEASHSLTSDYRTSYNDQSNIVLAQKQTHRSIEENRVKINPHTYG